MSEFEFSIEDLRLLAEVERKMDAGEVPYVYVSGSRDRCLMRPEAMKALGLRTGQTISSVMFMEILKLNIENCRQEIAFRNGQRFLAEEVPS